MKRSLVVAVALLALSLPLPASAGRGNPTTPAGRALATLQAGDFAGAEAQAREVVKEDPENAVAQVVLAIALYRQALHDQVTDIVSVLFGSFTGWYNERYLRWSFEQTEQALDAVAAALDAAAADPDLAFDLCLACWRVDWNRSGEVDERDRALFQVELDANGQPLPPDDPRRTPTFRVDAGDVAWARAFVAFQRAALNLLLAYRLPQPHEFAAAEDATRKEERRVVIRLVDKARVAKARVLILAGLEQADRARQAYLAETDDEREWVPNPRQLDHPLPLPVDAVLYETWAGVVTDLRALLDGREGLSMAELAQLGDHQWTYPPRGYLDVARLFEAPNDIVVDLDNLDAMDQWKARGDVERVLTDVFGESYAKKMKKSALPSRLQRMKGEMDRGEESFDRKLRYLLWLN